ncbi:hypothetical protein [Aquimarina pacifica]|nr:hypothetical protein [Aquimarina pacifica]
MIRLVNTGIENLSITIKDGLGVGYRKFFYLYMSNVNAKTSFG